MSLIQTSSFTSKYEGRASVLINECFVCMGFDPSTENNKPEFKQFKAIWDTGATNTVITKNVVDQLGLIPTGKATTRGVHGESVVNTFIVNVGLPNNVAIPLLPVTEGVLSDADLLIGMDIIGLGDFTVSNFKGKTTFSFRIPSTKDIDLSRDFQPIVNNPHHHKTDKQKNKTKQAKQARKANRKK